MAHVAPGVWLCRGRAMDLIHVYFVFLQRPSQLPGDLVTPPPPALVAHAPPGMAQRQLAGAPEEQTQRPQAHARHPSPRRGPDRTELPRCHLSRHVDLNSPERDIRGAAKKED